MVVVAVLPGSLQPNHRLLFTLKQLGLLGGRKTPARRWTPLPGFCPNVSGARVRILAATMHMRRCYGDLRLPDAVKPRYFGLLMLIALSHGVKFFMGLED